MSRSSYRSGSQGNGSFGISYSPPDPPVSMTSIQVQPTFIRPNQPQPPSPTHNDDSMHPTLSISTATPTVDTTTITQPSNNSTSTRNGYYFWQKWPGRNRPFACCGNVVLVARNTGVLAFNVAIIVVNLGVFSGLVAWHIHPAVTAGGLLIGLGTLWVLAKCTLTEAGILPRRKLSDYPPPPHPGSPVPGNNGPLYPAPTALVEGVPIQLKWCRTCNIYRPLRASHCRDCDNCVEEFDHHCPWVCNCVGKRNYRFFVGFLFMACAMDVYILFWSIFLLAWSASRELNGFVEACSHYPFAVIEALIAFCFIWCLGSLFGYHFFLILHNMTTNEYIKQSRARRLGETTQQNAAIIGATAPHAPYPTPQSSNDVVDPSSPTNAAAQHHSNGVGASHPLSAEHLADLASGHPHHTACCYSCSEFFCAPTPQSKINLEEWIPYDREQQTTQSLLQLQQQQRQLQLQQQASSRSYVPYNNSSSAIAPHYSEAQMQDDLQRSRMAYLQRQQQQQQQSQYELDYQTQQRRLADANYSFLAQSPNRQNQFQPIPSIQPFNGSTSTGGYAAMQPIMTSAPTTSTINSPSNPAFSSSASPLPAGGAPYQNVSDHDLLMHQTRVRTAQAEREIALLANDEQQGQPRTANVNLHL